MLKMKLIPPAGGGMSLIFITESFIQLIRSNVWFIQEWSKWQALWMGNHESLTHSIHLNKQFIHEWNTTVFAFRDALRLSCYFIWNYFPWWNGTNSGSSLVLYSDNASHLILTSCLLNCCIKSMSHLQTALIFKSRHSQFIVICGLTKNGL